MALDLMGAEIDAAVRAIAQATGRNIVLDPRVKGTINISSGKPLSKDLAYQVLVSALRLQGFSVIEGKQITKVMPDAEAKTQGGPVSVRGATTPGGDQIITRVFFIRFESAPQLVGALRPLVGNSQSITANANSNTLIVTDSADNIARLERVITAIDIAHGDDPRILPLKHVSAVEVAASLNRLFASRATQGAGNQLLVQADPRANRLIIQADNPGLLTRATKLAVEMDVPDAGLGNIRVIPLRYADATRMAATLRTLLGSNTGQSGDMTSPLQAPPASSALSVPANAGMAQASGNTPLTMATASTAGTAGAPGALVPGSLIQADIATNSLIVTAPPSVFNNLQNVVALLDRRRAQVHIEALIVELTAERAAEFGVQWQNLKGLDKNVAQAIGGTNFSNGTNTNIISAAANLATVGKGFNFGVVDGTINLPGMGRVTNLGFLARFLENEANANILSTPSVTTLDNEEARIMIGQNLPFVTGSYSTTGTSTSVTPFQTYERRDVGLTLKVRPQITAGGVVRIQIYQEASTVQTGTTSNATGPITNKRAIESSVMVDDGSIIALGGLIEDSFGVDEQKVPLLGDVPGLRNLFRQESRSRKKTNLVVFLKPQILREEADTRELATTRYEALDVARKKQAETLPEPLWGTHSPPVLPELPTLKSSPALQPLSDAAPR